MEGADTVPLSLRRDCLTGHGQSRSVPIPPCDTPDLVDTQCEFHAELSLYTPGNEPPQDQHTRPGSRPVSPWMAFLKGRTETVTSKSVNKTESICLTAREVEKILIQCEEHTSWANERLRSEHCAAVKDLRKAVADGVTLVNLIQILTKEKIGGVDSGDPPLAHTHKVDNIRRCLDHLDHNGLDIHSLNPQELANGNLKSTLVLMNSLRKQYDPEYSQRELADGAPANPNSRPSSRPSSRPGSDTFTEMPGATNPSSRTATTPHDGTWQGFRNSQQLGYSNGHQHEILPGSLPSENGGMSNKKTTPHNLQPGGEMTQKPAVAGTYPYVPPGYQRGVRPVSAGGGSHQHQNPAPPPPSAVTQAWTPAAAPVPSQQYPGSATSKASRLQSTGNPNLRDSTGPSWEVQTSTQSSQRMSTGPHTSTSRGLSNAAYEYDGGELLVPPPPKPQEDTPDAAMSGAAVNHGFTGGRDEYSQYKYVPSRSSDGQHRPPLPPHPRPTSTGMPHPQHQGHAAPTPGPDPQRAGATNPPRYNPPPQYNNPRTGELNSNSQPSSPYPQKQSKPDLRGVCNKLYPRDVNQPPNQGHAQNGSGYSPHVVPRPGYQPRASPTGQSSSSPSQTSSQTEVSPDKPYLNNYQMASRGPPSPGRSGSPTRRPASTVPHNELSNNVRSAQYPAGGDGLPSRTGSGRYVDGQRPSRADQPSRAQDYPGYGRDGGPEHAAGYRPTQTINTISRWPDRQSPTRISNRGTAHGHPGVSSDINSGVNGPDRPKTPSQERRPDGVVTRTIAQDQKPLTPTLSPRANTNPSSYQDKSTAHSRDWDHGPQLSSRPNTEVKEPLYSRVGVNRTPQPHTSLTPSIEIKNSFTHGQSNGRNIGSIGVMPSDIGTDRLINQQTQRYHTETEQAVLDKSKWREPSRPHQHRTPEYEDEESVSEGSVTPPLPPLSPSNTPPITPPGSPRMDPSAYRTHQTGYMPTRTPDVVTSAGARSSSHHHQGKKGTKKTQVSVGRMLEARGKKPPAWTAGRMVARAHPTRSTPIKTSGDSLDSDDEEFSFGEDESAVTDYTSPDRHNAITGNSTAEGGEIKVIRQQLEGLETMYLEVLKLLGVDKEYVPGSRRSISSASSISRTARRHKRSHAQIRTRDKRDAKQVNKRFQRLESHVVTLARSVAHLSSEIRMQSGIQQDLDAIKKDITDIKRERHGPAHMVGHMPGPGGGGKLPHQPSDYEKFRGWVPSLTNPKRVDKLTKFFGQVPPLLHIFLKRLGYERYAPNFDNERITMLELPYLNEDRLQKIGIPMGPRLRILQESQMCFRQENFDIYIV